jgi:VIT1/CCC1 family predicted Fe2+/Mn2+ transporter
MSQDLQHEHHAEAIKERVDAQQGHSYLRDAVLGAMDGAITTFAIVAGAVGGGFAGTVVVVLGLAKVVADALSMAVSNYLGTQSERQRVEEARRTEEHHIEHIPEGERDEIRYIFREKGFEGETLDEIVEVITRDHKQWVDTMIWEEFGLHPEAPSPWRAGAATFFAFLLVGFIPLIPFLLVRDAPNQAFLISGAVTALVFIAVGVFRGIVLNRPWWRSGLETLLTGSGAAAVAYIVGHWLRQRFGAV